MLEYPPTQLASISDSAMNNLQKVQNRALRFIYNIKWDDFVTNASLQSRAKITSIRERLIKLKNNSIKKLQEAHFQNNNEPPTYKFSDYNIQNPPLKTKTKEIEKCFKQFNNSNLFVD